MGQTTGNRFETDLDQNAANHAALTPVDFLVCSALAHPRRKAWIYGERSATYAEMHARCRKLASALRRHGVSDGESVAIMAQNGPAILEAHLACRWPVAY